MFNANLGFFFLRSSPSVLDTESQTLLRRSHFLLTPMPPENPHSNAITAFSHYFHKCPAISFFLPVCPQIRFSLFSQISFLTLALPGFAAWLWIRGVF